MFTIVFVLRLADGPVFAVRRWPLLRARSCRTIEGEDEKRAFVRYLPLFGFLPYLFVRTVVGDIFRDFLCARDWRWRWAAKTAPRLALAGLLCGLAFECRYQTGLHGTWACLPGWR